MAVSTENANLVWQKVKIALMNAHPAHQNEFRALKEYLATQGGNPDLQFIAYSAEDCNTNGGVDKTAAACKVYGWYGKARRTSGTTSAFVALHAAADNSATTTTLITSRLKATGQTFGMTFPGGLACETGLTIVSATAVGGGTESAVADSADGFILIGAA